MSVTPSFDLVRQGMLVLSNQNVEHTRKHWAVPSIKKTKQPPEMCTYVCQTPHFILLWIILPVLDSKWDKQQRMGLGNVWLWEHHCKEEKTAWTIMTTSLAGVWILTNSHYLIRCQKEVASTLHFFQPTCILLYMYTSSGYLDHLDAPGQTFSNNMMPELINDFFDCSI